MPRRVSLAFGALILLASLASAPNGGKERVSASAASGGAIFAIEADQVWRVPEVGETGLVHLALRITNASEQPQSFSRLDTVSIALVDGAGNTLLFDGARNGLTPGRDVYPQLAPGATLLITREAELLRVADRSLRLRGSDDFGGVWHFAGLAPGEYRVSMIYEDRRGGSETEPLQWLGRAETPQVAVLLK